MATVNVGGKNISLLLPKTDKTIATSQPGQKYGPATVKTYSAMRIAMGAPALGDGYTITSVNWNETVESEMLLGPADNKYWEVTWTGGSSGTAHGSMIGVVNEAFTGLGYTSGQLWYSQNDTGNYYSDGSVIIGLAPDYNVGDVIGLHYDAALARINFYKNGTFAFYGSISPGTSYYAKVTTGSGAVQGSEFFVNLGQEPFAYDVPAGADAGLYTTVPV